MMFRSNDGPDRHDVLYPGDGYGSRPPVPDLPSLCHAVWARRWMLAVGLVAGVLVAGYLLRSRPVYNAGAKILLQQGGMAAVDDRGGPGSVPPQVLQTQREILMSAAVLQRVAGSPAVARMAIFDDSIDRLATLKDRLELVAKGDTITVSTCSVDPQQAALLANAVVDGYMAYQANRPQPSSTAALRVLEGERDVQAAELERKRRATSAMPPAGDTRGAGPGDPAPRDPARLEALGRALVAAQLATVDAKVALDVAEDAGRGLDGGLGSGAGRGAQQPALELREAERQLDEAHTLYMPNHPRTQALLAHVNRLRAEVAEQRQSDADADLATLRRKVQSARQREWELRAAFDRERQSDPGDGGPADVAAVAAAAEVDRLQAVCAALDERIRRLKLAQAVPALSATVLERATPGQAPVGASTAKVACTSVAAGLLLATFAAAIMESLSPRIRTIKGTADALGIPVVGALPPLPRSLGPRGRGRVVAVRPASTGAEACRAVRTLLLHTLPGQAKSLLVTSASPREGKTTVASNLAVAMAQSGERVLLIDADLRRPTLHDTFGLPSGPGLAAVLAGRSALADAIRATEVERLDCLPAGSAARHPADLLGGQAFAAVLAQVSHRYDRVLLDAPPACGLADAQIVGHAVDVTIVVVRGGQTRWAKAHQLVNMLVGTGVRVFGVVVNDARQCAAEYPHYTAAADAGAGPHVGLVEMKPAARERAPAPPADSTARG